MYLWHKFPYSIPSWCHPTWLILAYERVNITQIKIKLKVKYKWKESCSSWCKIERLRIVIPQHISPDISQCLWQGRASIKIVAPDQHINIFIVRWLCLLAWVFPSLPYIAYICINNNKHTYLVASWNCAHYYKIFIPLNDLHFHIFFPLIPTCFFYIHITTHTLILLFSVICNQRSFSTVVEKPLIFISYAISMFSKYLASSLGFHLHPLVVAAEPISAPFLAIILLKLSWLSTTSTGEWQTHRLPRSREHMPCFRVLTQQMWPVPVWALSYP